MKKTIKFYSIIWLIALVLFNVIVFVTPSDAGNKFNGTFWVGYIFIMIAFISQFSCAYMAFKADNLKKTFYNIPTVSISYTGLVLMLIAGSVCMAVPGVQPWVGIVLCVFILALNAIAVIKAKAAAEIVEGIDEKIQTATFFIKSLTVDAQSLLTAAKLNELRTEAKKVYEAIRYSDPMSNAALSEMDAQIERQFNSFADALKAEDAELAKEMAAELIQMVENRNHKCKLLK